MFSVMLFTANMKELYQTRIQLWKDRETDEPKDEVRDNDIYTLSDAVKTIQAYLKGKKVKKAINWELKSDAVKTIMAYLKGKKVKKAINWELKKQHYYDCAIKRNEVKKQEAEEQHKKIIKLEEERDQLVRERDELKEQLLKATQNRHYSKIKFNVDELLHTRQTHYLRKEIKMRDAFVSQVRTIISKQ